MIGDTNPIVNASRLIESVFLMSIQKYGELTKRANSVSPIHSLPQIPCRGL